MTGAPREDATAGDHFAYFMVRVRLTARDATPDLTGVVELLGVGRKGPFPDGQALLRLLADWSRLSKMRVAEEGSNGTQAAL